MEEIFYFWQKGIEIRCLDTVCAYNQKGNCKKIKAPKFCYFTGYCGDRVENRRDAKKERITV